jgi:putative transcriptional regulator
MATRREPPSFDLIADEQDLAPSPALRERVLASVNPESRFEGFVERVARLFDLPEARAREILRTADQIASPTWVGIPIPGVQLMHLEGGPQRVGHDCGLVHVAAGASFPKHRHLGLEWNLVLSGAAEEDSGCLWLPGDLLLRGPETCHGYRVLPDQPVLFAVVLEARIEVVRGGDPS